MEKFVASTPATEVSGQALQALVNNLVSDEIKPLLSSYGLAEIDPEKWYPQQHVLDLLKAVREKGSEYLSMVAIGIQIVDDTPMPPLNSLGEVFGTLNQIHQLSHRNTEGREQVPMQRIGENHYEIINKTPYPDDLIYGYLYALLRRFAPAAMDWHLGYKDQSQVDGPGGTVYVVRLSEKMRR